MTYYECFAFMLVLLFFLRVHSLGKQLSQWETPWKPTQLIVQRLIFLIVGSGTLTGQMTHFIPSRQKPNKNSDKFVTATTAIITFVLFMLPSQPSSYGTTCIILGKMHSNTMMAILNNRIVLKNQDESIMLDGHVSSSASMPNPGISQCLVFSTSHSSILVTHEQSTIPLDAYKIQHVSIRYPSFSLTLGLIFPIFVLADIRVRKN